MRVGAAGEGKEKVIPGRLAGTNERCYVRERRRRPTLRRTLTPFFRPEIRRDYPLNLSISLSGGKETNQDSLSNGE